MNERIKKLRKALGLTQQEFAERLGIKRNTVANYETGRNTPIDAVVSLICREFDVNEEWLRTGEGDMIQQHTRDKELGRFFGNVLKNENDTFKKRLMTALSRLDEEAWVDLERVLVEQFSDIKKD